jgi:hydrogenase 3 maturation protease
VKNRLKTILKERFKGARRIALLGVGSDLRADDASGMLVAGKAEKALKRIRRRTEVKVFLGSTAPENLTGEVKSFKPDHIVIADTAEFKSKPGTVLVVSPEEIRGATFSTHTMPTGILADYFTKSLKAKITIIVIQPKSIKFGTSLSSEVKSASSSVASSIISAIR